MPHGSFTLAADIDAPLERVWDAYSDLRLRSEWRRIPGADSVLALDFRVGGSEELSGSFAPMGTVEAISSRSLFLDIVTRERIVSAQETLVNGVRRWVSLVSVAFTSAGGGTSITHTEQYTFLAWTGDGAHDTAHLRGSTRLSFNALAAVVAASPGRPQASSDISAQFHDHENFGVGEDLWAL